MSTAIKADDLEDVVAVAVVDASGEVIAVTPAQAQGEGFVVRLSVERMRNAARVRFIDFEGVTTVVVIAAGA